MCDGSGSSDLKSGKTISNELPGLGRGVYFAGGGFMPCDDDEDICDFGSGESETSMITPSEHEKSVGSSAPYSLHVEYTFYFVCALLNSV